MILGTVQLGINYGINNKVGKPKEETAFKLLDYAYNNGISCLDTASVYGNSEEIIGNYIKKTGNKFLLCTKLPLNIKAFDIKKYFNECIDKLCIDKLHIYYLHRFEHCKDKKIINELTRIKEDKSIKYVGVSIYEPNELEYILTYLYDEVDIVQLPFNLFDNIRWIKNDLLERAEQKGIKILARSVYLQGLFFSGQNLDKKIVSSMYNPIHQITNLAQSFGYSIAEFAIAYIKSQSFINNYIVGCETLEQLINNIVIDGKDLILDCDIQNEILKICETINQDLIDPRKW